MEMDMWKYYGITHTDHTVMNPMSLAKTKELIERLCLPDSGQVLDVVSGGDSFVEGRTFQVVDDADPAHTETFEFDSGFILHVAPPLGVQVPKDGQQATTGIVDGNHISWSGSYPEEGGTTTANINLNISGNSLNGSASWTWSGFGEVCSGTTRISGTRN